MSIDGSKSFKARLLTSISISFCLHHFLIIPAAIALDPIPASHATTKVFALLQLNSEIGLSSTVLLSLFPKLTPSSVTLILITSLSDFVFLLNNIINVAIPKLANAPVNKAIRFIKILCQVPDIAITEIILPGEIGPIAPPPKIPTIDKLANAPPIVESIIIGSARMYT